jgi:hypothetical protein
VFEQMTHWVESLDTAYKVMLGVPGSGLVVWAAKAAWQRIRPALSDEWTAQSDQFRAASPNLYALWNRYSGAPRVDWSLYPTEGATERDRELFQAEARRAARLFLRPLLQRVRIGRWIQRDLDDVWLDIISTLANPLSDVKISGRLFGVESEGGVMNDLAGMSVVACSRLASGEKPALRATLLAVVRFETQRRRLVRIEQQFLGQVTQKRISLLS